MRITVNVLRSRNLRIFFLSLCELFNAYHMKITFKSATKIHNTIAPQRVIVVKEKKWVCKMLTLEFIIMQVYKFECKRFMHREAARKVSLQLIFIQNRLKLIELCKSLLYTYMCVKNDIGTKVFVRDLYSKYFFSAN